MKVLHLIWCTSRPLAFGQACTAWSFRKHHPGWKIWLWLVNDGMPQEGTTSYLDRLGHDRVEVLPPAMIHPSLTSFEGLTHVLRFTLLYRFGGLYADFDIMFFHPLPFALDKDVLFVDLGAPPVFPSFPVGLLFAPMPASPFWKLVDEKASQVKNMTGGTLLLSWLLNAKTMAGAPLDTILDYLWQTYPPCGLWLGLRLLDVRSYRPVNPKDAPVLVAPRAPRGHQWLLAPLNPYRCFALQWYGPHPAVARALPALQKTSILGNAFSPFTTKAVKTNGVKAKAVKTKDVKAKAVKTKAVKEVRVKTPRMKSAKMKRLLAIMARK